MVFRIVYILALIKVFLCLAPSVLSNLLSRCLSPPTLSFSLLHSCTSEFLLILFSLSGVIFPLFYMTKPMQLLKLNPGRNTVWALPESSFFQPPPHHTSEDLKVCPLLSVSLPIAHCTFS